MKKAALSISVDEEVVARRKAKLMEAALKKRDRKGKSSRRLEPMDPLQIISPTESQDAERGFKGKRPLVEEKDVDMFADEVISIKFPVEHSSLSDPTDHLDEVRKCLFPSDERRFASLGIRQSAERAIIQSFQALQAVIYSEKQLLDISHQHDDILASKAELSKDNESLKQEIELLSREKEELEKKVDSQGSIIGGVERELKSLKVANDDLTRKISELEDAKENSELDASAAMQYKLMKEFKEHGGREWDVEKIMRDYEELQDLMMVDNEEDGDDDVGNEEKEADE